MGWGMDLGEYMTGLEKNPSYQLWRFTRDVMMAKDFGGFLYNVAGPVLKTGANFGYAASQLGDYWSGGTGSGGIEQQAALFTKASKDWGQAMQTTLLTLAFEHMKDGKIDRDAMAKSIRELYEGPNGEDIKNAYFLLTVTGYAAPDAQRIKDLIHYDASFDGQELERYLITITQEELKKNFQDFMENRLIQLARQSFRTGPKGNYTDWAFFQKKISDFYEVHPETMREVYASRQNPSQGQDIRRLITQEGVCRNIPALEAYLKGVLQKQKRRESLKK
jgi:hypothetical protein